MLKHVLRVAALIAVIAVAVVVYLAWPDTAKLSVDQVAGKAPRHHRTRATRTLPTVKGRRCRRLAGQRNAHPPPRA